MNLEQARRIAELAQERAGLLERLAEIDRELASETPSGNMPAPVSLPAAPELAEVEKSVKPTLPALLAEVAAEQKRPLRLAEFVQLVRQAGYTKEATDFPNMVYQALLKLVRQGVLKKDKADGTYSSPSSSSNSRKLSISSPM
jgi:hypothetical protein